MTTTENLVLEMPTYTESVDVDVLNRNFEKIQDSAAAMNTAILQNAADISGKVDKVAGKGLSTNDFTNADKIKLDGLENYEDAEITTGVSNATNIAAINSSTLGYSAKNLYKNTATSRIIAGVTFTVVEDLINASGTTTGDCTYIMFSTTTDPYVFNKDVIVTYTGTLTNINLRVRFNTTNFEYNLIPVGGFRVPAGTEISQVYLQQTTAGKAVSVSDFGVMFRYADIKDDTYEPYKPSVQEQIDALIVRIAAIENSDSKGGTQ